MATEAAHSPVLLCLTLFINVNECTMYNAVQQYITEPSKISACFSWYVCARIRRDY